MFKIILASFFGKVLSQQSMVGGSLDSHNCMIGAGYTWCESSQNCIRMWETPCEDNFNNCDECLMKQRNGQNIACPTNCDIQPIDAMPSIAVDPIPMPPIAIDPMPPAPPPIVIDPVPNLCSDVMCMMYCPYGHRLDANGCQMCDCNDELPPPVTGTDCEIPSIDCSEYEYVCPKITEITNCNEGGIPGYTTYQLSLQIKNDNVKNIYALYGDSEDELYLPPAYQTPIKFGDNIGGINPVILRINPDSQYDSWLTIGVTDEGNNNLVSSIGIDFDSWTDTHGIEIRDGAVFVLDQDQNIINGNEYIIAQITVSTDSNYVAIFNAQGKTLDTGRTKSWTETNIRFPLISPTNIEHETVPNNCNSWYDGCNTCRVVNGQIGGCTRMMCFQENTPRCLNYVNPGH